jgi:hypothetical protein
MTGIRREATKPGEVKVSSYVTIHDNCPMRYRVNGDTEIEFSIGGHRNPFEFEINAAALRDLLWLGTKALAEITADSGQTTSTDDGSLS